MFTINNYPKQYASIEKGDWRLQDYLHLSEFRLKIIENILWRFLKGFADKAKKPPERMEGYNLIASGWEWIVYGDDRKVVKIPRDIFPEVATSEYYENTIKDYEVIKEYFGKQVAETKFENGRIVQDRLDVKSVETIKISDLSVTDKMQLRALSKNTLKMLDEYDWMPDFNIDNNKSGEWKIDNIGKDDQGDIKIYDFTIPYDVFRLYPDRTEKEKKWKESKWREFYKQLQ